MYNNPYMPYNNQFTVDRINAQMAELEKMKEQLQKPVQQQMTPNINQTFQLAPTSNNNIKYANSMEEVQRDMVTGDTPYFSKDMSVVWIKNTNGEVKIYELNEIVAKDDKDLKIEYLQAQIEELKKGMKVYESKSNIDEPITSTNQSEESSNVANVSKLSKKQK